MITVTADTPATRTRTEDELRRDLDDVRTAIADLETIRDRTLAELQRMRRRTDALPDGAARVPGYYRIKHDGAWCVAYYGAWPAGGGYAWVLSFLDEVLRDEHLDEIDEERIVFAPTRAS